MAGTFHVLWGLVFMEPEKLENDPSRITFILRETIVDNDGTELDRLIDCEAGIDVCGHLKAGDHVGVIGHSEARTYLVDDRNVTSGWLIVERLTG